MVLYTKKPDSNNILEKDFAKLKIINFCKLINIYLRS